MNFFFRKSKASNNTEKLLEAVRTKAIAQQYALRREVLKTALRDTLLRLKIDHTAIACETSVSSRTSSDPKMHVRLVVKQLNSDVLAQGVTFQKIFLKRVSLLDPKATQWLSSVLWQFEPLANGLFSEASVTLTPAQLHLNEPLAVRESTGSASKTSKEQESVAALHKIFMAADVERSIGGIDVEFQNTEPFHS